MFKSLTPNLMVEDVSATVKYYENNFDFKLANKTETKDDELEWAVVRAGDIEIFFQNRESLTKEMPVFKDKDLGATATLYIRVEDIKSLYEKVKSNVEIIRDMKKTFYGAQEFAIKDLNGYILVFSMEQK